MQGGNANLGRAAHWHWVDPDRVNMFYRDTTPIAISAPIPGVTVTLTSLGSGGTQNGLFGRLGGQAAQAFQRPGGFPGQGDERRKLPRVQA